MTKKTWVLGEQITVAELNKLLSGDLKGEALYGGIDTKLADYVITDTDNLAIIVADGTSVTVEVTLPAATGSGRIIFMVCIDDSHAVTMIPTGAEVIDAAYVLYTFLAWENACVVDIAAGQWATLVATATPS